MMVCTRPKAISGRKSTPSIAVCLLMRLQLPRAEDCEPPQNESSASIFLDVSERGDDLQPDIQGVTTADSQGRWT